MQKHQTKMQAAALLDKIQMYWASKGFRVQGTIFEAGYNERLRSTVYEVHTDLRNGMPVQWAPDEIAGWSGKDTIPNYAD